MSMRSVATIAVTLVLVLYAGGCGDDDASSRTFATAFTLRDASGDERTTFAAGETVTMTLEVRNRTKERQTIPFLDSQTFDFEVARDGSSAPLWRAFDGAVKLPITGELEFAADETKIFSFEWHQVDNDDVPVGTGRFEARGYLTPARCAGCAPLPDSSVADVHRRELVIR